MSSGLAARCAAAFASPSGFQFSIVHPVEITTSPPPTCTTGNEIPKNDRMCVPTSSEAISSRKLFSDTRRASDPRCPPEYSLVRLRKIGVPPSGFTIGNNALKISTVLFTTSSTSLTNPLQTLPPPRSPLPPLPPLLRLLPLHPRPSISDPASGKGPAKAIAGPPPCNPSLVPGNLSTSLWMTKSDTPGKPFTNQIDTAMRSAVRTLLYDPWAASSVSGRSRLVGGLPAGGPTKFHSAVAVAQGQLGGLSRARRQGEKNQCPHRASLWMLLFPMVVDGFRSFAIKATGSLPRGTVEP